MWKPPLKRRTRQSFGVIDPVVERLGPPEGVGVVELEEVDARAGVVVRACVDFLVAVPPVDGHDHRRRGALLHQGSGGAPAPAALRVAVLVWWERVRCKIRYRNASVQRKVTQILICRQLSSWKISNLATMTCTKAPSINDMLVPHDVLS